MIITIDGYSITGKSSVSSLLAQELGFIHMNSGLIFRAISYEILKNNINTNNFQEKIEEIAFLIKDFQVDFKEWDRNYPKLRTTKVTELGMQLSKYTFVRQKVVELLKKGAQNQNVVVEGRDIGTVVFPNADRKFFFIADIDTRVSHVQKETQRLDIDNIRAEIEWRDKEDETREISPLRKASDAIEIDTTNLTINEIVQLVKEYI